MNYEKFNNELVKRLSGYPINMMDRNSSPLVVGNIVKVYYDDDEKKYVLGKIKYDFLHKKFIVRLNEIVNNFNSKKRNLILIQDKDCIYSKIIENTGQHIRDNYTLCKMQMEKRENYKEFYNKIVDLFYDDEIQLLEDEINIIKNEISDVVNVNVTINIDILDYNNEKSNMIMQNCQSLSDDIENLLIKYNKLKCNNIGVNIKNNNTLIYIKTPLD